VASGITADLNLANPNAWTGAQTFGGSGYTPTTPGSLGAADVIDYALCSTNSYYRISAGANINLKGLQNGTPGRIVILQNVGAFTITIKSQAGAPTPATDQFDLPGGADVILGPKGIIKLIYDNTLGFWEEISTN